MLVVELTPEAFTRAQTLLQRHPIRPADEVQLASCLQLRNEFEELIAMATFHDRPSAAARPEKLPLE